MIEIPNGKRVIFVTAFKDGNSSGGEVVTAELIASLRKKVSNTEVVCFSNFPSDRHRALIVHPVRRAFGLLICPFLHPLFTGRLSIFLVFRLIWENFRGSFLVLNFSQVFLYSLFFNNDRTFLIGHDVLFQNFYRRKGFLNLLSSYFVFLSEFLVLKASKGRLLFLCQKDVDLAGDLYGVQSCCLDWGMSSISSRVVSLSLQSPIRKFDFPFFVAFGNWSRPENFEGLSWFLEEVVPSLSSDFHLVVIGAGLADGLSQHLSRNSNAHYIGFLENPYAVMRQSLGLVAPIFVGAGVKIKCIEAIACGLPIFGTDVALEGLNSANANLMFRCNTKLEFVYSISAVMDSAAKL